MGILRHQRLLTAYALVGMSFCLTSECSADIPHLLESVDLTTSGGAGWGSLYSLGGASSFHFGDPGDESNKSAVLNVSYSADYSPSDPTNALSPLKQADTWTGGYEITLWKGVTLGVDLDGLTDDFENLQTNGIKETIGWDPLKISYRFARSSIENPFKIPVSNVLILGAVIYQHTGELDYNWKMSDDSSLIFDAAYSLFNPPATTFGEILQLPALASFSNFTDTLQSFEQWKTGATWIMLWNDLLDSTSSFHISHLIIPADTQVDAIFAVGYILSPAFHVQVGWEYTHDPTQTANVVSTELRWTWDRKANL